MLQMFFIMLIRCLYHTKTDDDRLVKSDQVEVHLQYVTDLSSILSVRELETIYTVHWKYVIYFIFYVCVVLTPRSISPGKDPQRDQKVRTAQGLNFKTKCLCLKAVV